MTFKAVFVRDPIKVKSDDWQETAHQWAVVIGGQSFDYFTGLGHREVLRPLGDVDRYNQLSRGVNLSESQSKELLKLSKPTPPKLDDVLSSLVMDASATERSFPNWCDDFGYDTDSRKALSIYEQCQVNADKLVKAGIDIDAERERLQDY